MKTSRVCRFGNLFHSQNPWIIWGMLLGVCLVAYASSLNNQFMLDDYVILFGENGVANKTVGSLFSARQHLFYRPVGHLFLMLSYHLFGDSQYGYHVANLLFLRLLFLKQKQCDQAYKVFWEAKRLYPKDRRYEEYLKITRDCK